ncbi:hypothetical protein GEMRC1_003095 [Eukaryota sp. GEM-RC1]
MPKLFKVEPARRSSSTCRHCKDKIEKGVLRVAKVVWRKVSKREEPVENFEWYHLECIDKVPSTAIETPEEFIYGYSDLSDEQKTDLLAHFEAVKVEVAATEKVTETFDVPSCQSHTSDTLLINIETFRKHLLRLKESRFCCDLRVVHNDIVFDCHHLVLSSSSSLFDSVDPLKVEELECNFMDDFGIDSSLFLPIINTFYLSPLVITMDNFFDVMAFAKKLNYEKLLTGCKQLKSTRTNEFLFQLEVNDVASAMKRSHLNSVKLKYKDVVIDSDVIVLSMFSDFFKNLWSHDWKDSSEREFDFSSKLWCSGDNFVQFFNVFYLQSFEIDSTSVYDIFHLSTYFQFEEGKRLVSEFLLNSFHPDQSWLIQLVKTCDKFNDTLFYPKFQNSSVILILPKLKFFLFIFLLSRFS